MAGSNPGERRGGRSKGVPNVRTVAANAMNAAALGHIAQMALGDRLTAAQMDQIAALGPELGGQAAVDAVRTLAEALAEHDMRPFCGNAHRYLVDTYQDPRLPRVVRMEAAKAAIRYETPALESVSINDVSGNAPPTLDAYDTRRALSDQLHRLLGPASTRVTDVDGTD